MRDLTHCPSFHQPCHEDDIHNVPEPGALMLVLFGVALIRFFKRK